MYYSNFCFQDLIGTIRQRILQIQRFVNWWIFSHSSMIVCFRFPIKYSILPVCTSLAIISQMFSIEFISGDKVAPVITYEK